MIYISIQYAVAFTGGGCHGDMATPLKISICSNYKTITKKKKGQFIHIIIIYDTSLKISCVRHRVTVMHESE